MNQKVMWDYYQGLGKESFSGAAPRLSFLVNIAAKISGSNKNKILNVGVGNGYLEQYATKQGFVTHSLDPSEIAINKLAQSGLAAKVGYMDAIPYESGLFDFVFCSEVIEHLPSNALKPSLAEINRVLIKGGYLIGTVPYDEFLLASHVVCPSCEKSFHRWGHQQSFNKPVMAGLLQELNFEIIKLETHSFLQLAGKDLKGKIRAVGSWFLGRLGVSIANPNLLFIARKP